MADGYYDSEGFMDAVRQAGTVPNSIDRVMQDGNWQAIFIRWLDDTATTNSDYIFSCNVAKFWSQLDNGMSFDNMRELYCEPMSSEYIEFPADARKMFDEVIDGLYDDGEARSSLRAYCSQWLEVIYPYFTDFLRQNQWAPQAATLTRDRIDDAVVDNVNQATLKGMREPGQAADFWQTGDLVLIGGGHAASYYQFVTDSGGVQGQIEIVSRGSAFSSGEIRVTGCTDQARFKQAVRRFSDKKITYV